MSTRIFPELFTLLVAVCVCPALLQRVLQTNEENSSPSHVNSAKGSSIYLHWNYTYIGDGTHGIVTTKYKEQVLGFKVSPNSNIYVLAKRIGQNGAVTLQSPLPTPFNGRVQVISSNSSLVVHNLQYNDSKYQLSSAVIVNVNFGAGPKENKYNLKPIVSVSVYGIPEFTILPPKTLDVNEYSDLHVLIGMDGSPKPSADFRWSHLPPSSKTNIASVQLYPFVYSSTYTLKNIDASYCGRILQTTLKNSIGPSSVTASTNVTVSLKLDKPINMTVKKLPKPGCLEVRWNQVDSGACNVRYDVVWKTASRGRMANRSGYNIDKMTICDVKTGTEIISAQLIVRFRNTVKHLDITISEEPMTTAPPIKADSNTSLIVGSVVGVLVAVLGIIILFIWCYKKFKSRCQLRSSKGNGKPPRGKELQRGPSIVEPLPSASNGSTALSIEHHQGDGSCIEQIILETSFENPVYREDIEIPTSSTDCFTINQEKEITQEINVEMEESKAYAELKPRNQIRNVSCEALQTGYAAFGAVPESHFAR